MKKIVIILFIVTMATNWDGIECFATREEEYNWRESILNQTTNTTPHSHMRNNTVYLYVDLYQLLGIDEKVIQVAFESY